MSLFVFYIGYTLNHIPGYFFAPLVVVPVGREPPTSSFLRLPPEALPSSGVREPWPA